MYKIFADDTLIYDSTIEDYHINSGVVSLEVNKSGSFTFSIYPDHFYYNSFVKLKTVIKVYKDNRIIFRGRILNDVTDYWNNKVITCEGELGFLQDSMIRPFNFKGTPENLFRKFINDHNSQVDDFKKFKIGTITVTDPNNYISRKNEAYESAFANVNNRLLEDSLGGYLFITHGEDGTEEIPTIHYLADFNKVSSQSIKFGSNLRDYTKSVKSEEIATAIIPLGYTMNNETRLTISKVNNGKDYVYDPDAVAMYGWIFKTVEFDDVTNASTLKTKGEEYLQSVINQNITIELNAIDLHLLDKNIESFSLGDYIRVVSEPHNFNSVLLCSGQTIDILKPENDSLVLGNTYKTFTESSSKLFSIQKVITNTTNKVENLNQTVITVESEITCKSPAWGVSENITISANSVVEKDILLNKKCNAIPEVVTVTPYSTAQGVHVGITVSNITETGFHVTITNDKESEVVIKIMYVAYPTIQNEEVTQE